MKVEISATIHVEVIKNVPGCTRIGTDVFDRECVITVLWSNEISFGKNTKIGRCGVLVKDSSLFWKILVRGWYVKGKITNCIF